MEDWGWACPLPALRAGVWFWPALGGQMRVPGCCVASPGVQLGVWGWGRGSEGDKSGAATERTEGDPETQRRSERSGARWNWRDSGREAAGRVGEPESESEPAS